MAKLLACTPRDELAARYPGNQAGVIGAAALPAPSTLMIIIGHTSAQLSHAPGATAVTSMNTTPPSSCTGSNCLVRMGVESRGVDLILSVVALALLFPLLIFIATATRLSAARREQRFAAMRLAGAAPRQISLIAAVEAVVAAVPGTGAGFGIFFALRTPLAAIPFTGIPFFPNDLSLSIPDIVLVALGVPLAAALAARIALRRVHISPLGVSRRVTPRAPKPWRALPLLAGLADLGYFVVAGSPSSIPGQILAYFPGFALIVLGLVLAGPWLTKAGAAALIRRTSRPATLIAARRLADDPRAGFRAVSGLVLALFVTTVAVAVITTINVNRSSPAMSAALNGTLADQLTGPESGPAPALPAADLAALRATGGVAGVMIIHANVLGVTIPVALTRLGPGTRPLPARLVGLASCAELARVPALGHCPAGAQAVAFPEYGVSVSPETSQVTWPAAPISAASLAAIPADAIAVGTSGSSQAIERARTVLDQLYPYRGTPVTYGQLGSSTSVTLMEYRQLADVVVLVSLPIAGCTLAASVAAGLSDRRRPFSLLRLTGAPLGLLRRVVMLESAVPLLVVAAFSAGTGFAASALFLKSQLSYALTPPQPAYYLISGAGLVVALGIIAATFPLLRRVTGPDVARNE